MEICREPGKQEIDGISALGMFLIWRLVISRRLVGLFTQSLWKCLLQLGK